MTKWMLLLGLLALALLALLVVSSKRDSKYYHWASIVIAPVTQALLPKVHAVSEPVVDVFDRRPLQADWQWFKPELIDVSEDAPGLKIDTLTESVWYHNQRGPMLYRNFTGDGDIRVRVRTRKTSDPQHYPDKEWQFAGLIFRDPASDAWFSRENYVFNVIGHRYNKLQLEVKSTRSGRSDVSGFDWQSGDADILIRRQGALFTLMAKPFNEESWKTFAEYQRPDLPEVLQVGLIVYAYSEGRQVFDLQASFEDFRLQPH